jgi:predicted nucleotide-binding protein
MPSHSFSPRTLGLVAQVAPDYFTHTGLQTLLLTYGLDETQDAGTGNKQQLVVNAVRRARELQRDDQQDVLRGLVAEVLARLERQPTQRWSEREKALVDSVQKDGWIFRGNSLIETVPGTADAVTAEVATPVQPTPSVADIATNNKVFIVHGREITLKDAVARHVERLGFVAVVLHERENRGRTVLEKLVGEASDAAFAVVLLTPDDEGGLRGSGRFSPRARQNVVLEYGYFVGLLGRSRVAALLYEDVEIPSDLQGLLYIKFDSGSDDWKMSLAREMRAAGLPIDLNSL